jgi:hypothetical protein
MKILSVMKHGNYYTVFYETDSDYVRDDLFINNIATTKYPREQHGEYDQFINIVRKFDTDTKFLIEPVEVEEINFDSIKILYNKLSVQFGW